MVLKITFSSNLPAMSKLIDNMRLVLREQGWFHLQAIGERKFIELTAALGEVIHVTDVVIKPESQGLVTSTKPLDFHTDHSKVDYVAWLCKKPDARGGNTILADARKAFSLLRADEKRTLQTVMLTEHRMFENDPAQSPLVSQINGNLRFYYSFWLVNKDMAPQQRQAFDAFRRALATIPFHELKLQRNDILIVDNSYIFHGRRAILDPNRYLKRFWINSTHQLQYIGGNHENNRH